MTPIVYQNQRVITTDLLAQAYETNIKNIRMNFRRNQNRFVEGRHYFRLEGAELRNFKNHTTDSSSVSKNTACLFLWTERGANRHSKILDTDKAWEQFENLEETYFRVKEAGTYSLNAEPIFPSKPASIGEIASLLREERLIMQSENCSGYKIARQAEITLKAFGLPVIPDFVEPSYEQVTLSPLPDPMQTTFAQ